MNNDFRILRFTNVWLGTLLLGFLFLNTFYAQSNKINPANPDSTASKNISTADSSLKTLAKTGIVKFSRIGFNSNDNGSSSISKKKLETIDYRFIGDFLNAAPFSFIKDFGSVGYPNSVSLYGQKNSGVLFNGGQIPMNVSALGEINLNLLQSESIDSIEVVSLPRAFLFGNNNSSAVVFYPRVPQTNKAYSRLRYYQAPVDEALFDGIFSLTPIKKLNTYIQVTNHSNNPRYRNSDYSNWMASVRLNYLLSAKSSLAFNYWHANSKIQLNGGVDLVAIENEYGSEQINSILYNNISAPVNYTNRYLSNINNTFALNFNTELFSNTQSIATIYYHDYLGQFRQNIGSLDTTMAPVKREHKTKVLGATFLQKISYYNYSFNGLLQFERLNYSTPFFLEEVKKSTVSFAFDASAKLLNGKIVPALFGKFSSYSNEKYFSFGSDLSIHLLDDISIYLGYANQRAPFNVFEAGYRLESSSDIITRSVIYEAKAAYKKESLNASAGFFTIQKSNEALPAFLSSNNEITDNIVFTSGKNYSVSGINLNMDLRVWKFLFNTTANFYFNEESRKISGLPNFNSRGGIYYVDTLFNNSLDLKTGITFSTIGSRFEERFDFEKGFSSSYVIDRTTKSVSLINSSLFKSELQLDFFLSGRIQQNAIIYFVFENLLDNKYYLIPYYPKQPRGIRLGVAWEFFD